MRGKTEIQVARGIDAFGGFLVFMAIAWFLGFVSNANALFLAKWAIGYVLFFFGIVVLFAVLAIMALKISEHKF